MSIAALLLVSQGRVSPTMSPPNGRAKTMIGNLAHCDAGLFQYPGGASGGQNFDAGIGEKATKLDHSGFIGDRNQRPPYGSRSGLGRLLDCQGRCSRLSQGPLSMRLSDQLTLFSPVPILQATTICSQRLLSPCLPR